MHFVFLYSLRKYLISLVFTAYQKSMNSVVNINAVYKNINENKRGTKSIIGGKFGDAPHICIFETERDKGGTWGLCPCVSSILLLTVPISPVR
jgi:hypothetical protein